MRSWSFKVKHGAGGPNRAEIRGVKIECSRLRYETTGYSTDVFEAPES